MSIDLKFLMILLIMLRQKGSTVTMGGFVASVFLTNLQYIFRLPQNWISVGAFHL